MRRLQQFSGLSLSLSLSLSLCFLLVVIPTSTVQAGRNAGGALILHTNDAYTYSQGTACTTAYAVPSSCEAAITRTDKSEGSVVWVLASFDSTASPAVTVVYFGIDYDDENLDPGSAYRFCGPSGTLEVPDGDWPYTGRGNSVAFGDAVTGQLLFPFYVFRIDGGSQGSYFSTAVNPSAGYAAFVDDSDPPELDEVTRFGTVRWFAAGESACSEEGDVQVQDSFALEEHGEDSWQSNCILLRLSDSTPLPPPESTDSIGVAALDALSRQLGVTQITRATYMSDSLCGEFPEVCRVLKLVFRDEIDELAVSAQYEQLSEVVDAHPNYAVEPTFFSDDEFSKQWYLVDSATESCLPDPVRIPCLDCDIGIDQAWATGTRGSPTVKIAFFDGGADMQHPDLLSAWAINAGEDDGDGIAELCDVPEGDINHMDDDGNDIVDDVVLGFSMTNYGQLTWEHWPSPAQVYHGTQVASLLGAVTDNDVGIASVAGGDGLEAGGVRLIQFSSRGGLLEDLALRMLTYALEHGAHMFSVSGPFIGTTEIRRTVNAYSRRMLFIAAVGNHGVSPPPFPFTNFEAVMAVGGYDHTGGRWVIPYQNENYPYDGWRGSNYGTCLSVLSPADDSDNEHGAHYPRTVMPGDIAIHGIPPGYDCPAPDDENTGCFGGTSAAAPIAASVAALIISYLYDNYTLFAPPDPHMIRKTIELTAEDVLCEPLWDDVGCGCEDRNPPDTCARLLLGWDPYSGYGRVDAGRALTLPVIDLDTLSTVFLFRGEPVTLTWTAWDINQTNGTLDPDDPDAHIELDYLLPGPGVIWYNITDAISVSASSYVWEVPGDFPLRADHRFRLTIYDSEGNTNCDYSELFEVKAETSVEVAPAAAQALTIQPNPFGDHTTIDYRVTDGGSVRVDVLDASGRRVEELFAGPVANGAGTVVWDGRDRAGRTVEAGVYFVRLSDGGRSVVTRLIRVR